MGKNNPWQQARYNAWDAKNLRNGGGPGNNGAGDTYTVQNGDSWESIAGKIGGDQRKFSFLANQNGGGGRVLHPGDVISIPGGFSYKWKTPAYVSPTSAAYEGMSPSFDKQSGQPTWDYSVLGSNYKGPMGGSAASAYPSIASLAAPAGLGYTPKGFEDPKTVSQLWTWSQANPGKPLPGDVNPVQLKAAYDWFSYRNPGKTPDQWGYLSADDPGRAGLQKIGVASMPGTGNGLVTQPGQDQAQPNLQMQPNGIDLSKAPAWQSTLFGFFSDPGAIPAVIGGGLGTLGGPAGVAVGAGLGYAVGKSGSILTAGKEGKSVNVLDLLPGEQQVIKAFLNLMGKPAAEVRADVVPDLNILWGIPKIAEGVLAATMAPMQAAEQAMGVRNQVYDYATHPQEWSKPFDWRAAWDASKVTYDAMGADTLGAAGNIPAAIEMGLQQMAKGDDALNVALGASSPVAWGLQRIARMFPDGNWKNEDLKFAQPGEVWKMGEANPVKVDNLAPAAPSATPTDRLLTAIRFPGTTIEDRLLKVVREDMMQPGADPEQVAAKYRDTFGLSGQIADLVGQTVFDPMKLVPRLESSVGKDVAHLTGNEALSNVYQKSINAGHGGLFEGTKQLTAEARTGQVGDLSPFEKWLTGVSSEGKIAELNKTVLTGNKVVDFANTMRQLTPRSKAEATISLMRDHIFGSLLNRSQVDGVPDPAEFVKLYNARADFDYQAAANIADATMGGPEGYTIQPLLRTTKEYVSDQAKLWQTLDAPGGPREILTKVSNLLGMTPDEVLKSFRDKETTGLLDFQRLADRAAGSQNEGAKAISEMIKSGDFTPENLKTALQVYEQPGVPHSPEEWFGNVMTNLDDKYQKWLVDYYGIKTENAAFRSIKVAKAIMSMALLNSPSFFFRNVMNNQITNFSETGSIMPNFQAREWLTNFGAIPSRLHEGVGMTGEANSTGDTTGLLDYKQSGAIGQAEKGGMDKLSPNANILQKGVEGALGTAESVIGALKSSPVGKYGLGLAQTASGAMEGLQGEQVFVHAMSDHFAHAWQPGVGFDRMSPAVEAAIERQVPGATKLIYDAIRNGMNSSDLDALLKSQSIGQSMPGLLDAAASEMGMPVDQMREMLMKTGVLDDLQQRMASAKTPAERLRAFDATQQLAHNYLDQMAASEYGDIAKNTEARVKLEGPVAAAEELAKMQMGIADRWMGQVRTMSEMMDNLGNLTDPERRAYVMATRMRDSSAWTRQNNFARSTFQGVFNAWGVEDGAARNALKLMLDSHTAWDAAFKERGRMQDEFFTNLFEHKANPMDWEVMTAKIDSLFEKAYQSDLKIQGKLTGQFGDILATQFGQPAGDVFKSAYKEVGDFRTMMWKQQQEHIANTRGLDAPGRKAAWTQFNDTKVNWINEWRQRYTDAINKAMGFYKDSAAPGNPADPSAPVSPQPMQPLSQEVTQVPDANTTEVLRVAAEHGLPAGQNLPDATSGILDTVNKYAGADGKSVRSIEDVTPQMAEKAFQNKEAQASAQQQLDAELQAQKAADVAAGAVEPPVVEPAPSASTQPAQYRSLTPDEVRQRQNDVMQVMAEHGMPTADVDGQPIPLAKLDMLNVVRLYGPGDAHMTLRFSDITPEMARDAFANATRMAPENVDGMVRDIWNNDPGNRAPDVLTPEQQHQADVFSLLQNKPVSELPPVLRDPVRGILGDMLNQVRAGRKMSLLEWIKSKGGIDMQYLRDVTGEGKVQRSWGPGLFKKSGGLSLDELASRMEDEMYMTPGDMNNPSDNGGINRAVELIRNELSGTKAFSFADEAKSEQLPGWYEGMKGLKNKQAKVALTIQQMLQGLDNVSGGAEATATERVIKNEVWRQLGDQATYDGNLAQATGHPYGWNEFKALLDDIQAQIPNADAQRIEELLNTLNHAYFRAPDNIPAPIAELQRQVFGDLLTAGDKAELTTANDNMTTQLERAQDKAKLHMSADYLREQLVTKFGYTPEAADNNVALAKARAQTWATLTGNSVDDWFTRSFADILGKDQQLPKGDQLNQDNYFVTDAMLGKARRMAIEGGAHPEWIAVAKKQFGLTKDYREAGYILPDGGLLDFSGKRDGGTPGNRAYDHRDIGKIIPDEFRGSNPIANFASDTGAVRVHYEANGLMRVDTYGTITEAQYKVISSMLKTASNVNVDVANGVGDNVINIYMENKRPSATSQAIRSLVDGVFGNADAATLKDMAGKYETYFQSQSTQIAGATQFLPDQSAVIKAFPAADPSTFTHEFGHVLRRDLYRTFDETGADWIKADIDTLEQHFGVQNGAWDKPQEEAFARTWENYLMTKEAPSTGLKAVFDHFKAVMVQVYKSIVGSPIDVTMSDEVRGVFDRLISERDAAPAAITPEVNDAGQVGGMLPGMQNATGQLFDVQPGNGTLNKMEAPNARSVTDVVLGKRTIEATGQGLKPGDIVSRDGKQYQVKGVNYQGNIISETGEVLKPADVKLVAGQGDMFAQAQPPVAEPIAPDTGLQDFGEKLGGARKDKAAFVTRNIPDGDIKKMSLSEIWPKSEIANIQDADTAALATVLRDAIPTKPQTDYKLNSWAEKVKLIRSIMDKVDNVGGIDKALEMMKGYPALTDLAQKVNLLRQIPREQWGRVDDVHDYPRAAKYVDGKMVSSPYASAHVDGVSIRADNLTGLIDKVNEALNIKPEAAAATMKFEVRGHTGSWSINKTGDPLYRGLMDFTDSKEALKFARDPNNRDALVKAWEDVKVRDNVQETDVRRDVNAPRAGQDYRQGKNATPQMFLDQFGFRGAEFGNWVSQGANIKERQGMLNGAYDALMDLSKVTGIPPKALSMDGALGLGFGSRGSGSASAHYEPSAVVINLTKTRGAGTLAYEWFHALDNYFQKMRSNYDQTSREKSYITYSPQGEYQKNGSRQVISAKMYNDFSTGGNNFNQSDWAYSSPGVRPEMEQAFTELVKSLNASPMNERSQMIDKGQGGYWSRIVERAARAFENYTIYKMQQLGIQNDYLANVKNLEAFNRNPERYPYLTDAELKPVAEAFDNLFGTVQTKETSKGLALYQEQPGQSPLETAPALPLGGVEGVNAEPPMAQIYHEGFTKDLLPALDALRTAYEGGADKGFSLGDLSPDNLDAFRRYLAQVKTQMPGVKLATMRYGEIKRDAAMLNYSRRRGIGKLMDVYSPYRFWTTESMGQWAQRAVDNPAWLSTYARLKQAGQMYQANEPDRLKGKIRIPIPGMPSWAGGGIYIDPTGVLFPYTNFTLTPLERMQQNAQNQTSGGEYKVRQWASDSTISAAEAKQALDTHAGATWERALAASLNEADAEQATPMDYITSILSPALYITAPLNAMGLKIPGVSSGDKNDIGLTQATKTVQNFQTALSGTPMEGIGNMVGMLAKPEQWLRDKAGMSKLGTIGNLDLYSYYVNRQLAVMVSEGYPLKLAQVAMLEKQGPMYDQAVQRVAQEQTFKQDGMGALYLAAHGDFLDAVNPALLFSSGILSNGELEMRGDKQKFLDALKAKDAGDKTAITTFFNQHPEYSAKLNMSKNPDEMMRSFLSSEIWDKYNGLNAYEKKVARGSLGNYFNNAFLNPETRDPNSVNTDQLAMWAKVLNGYVPGSDKMPDMGITPQTMQTQPAQMPDPAFSAAVSSYYDQRDTKFPNYYELQNGYYALPSGSSQAKSYLLQHPDLAKYWDWNRAYKLQHPEVQLVNDMAARKVDMTQFNDLLKQQLSWYAAANVPLSNGGYAELKRVWENNGKPSGNLKTWLDAVIKPNLLMPPDQAQP